MGDKIKIMIADDMEAHRRRLERIICLQKDMELVKSANSGTEAVQYTEIYKPDIILMDIEMENKYAGIDASKKINERFNNIKIIILTVHIDDSMVFAAFQTGIVDYVLKTASNSEIIEAIRTANKNLSPIRPIIAEKIRKEFQKTKTREENLLYILHLISSLTPSELEVLNLLNEGKTRKQIALERFVEDETIKKQINSILKKCEKNDTRSLVGLLRELQIFDVLKKLLSKQ